MAKMRKYITKPSKVRRQKRRSKYWIQDAIKRPGALTRKLKGPLGKKVARATHMPVFTKSGEINTNALRKFTKTPSYQKLDTLTKHQIQFALRAEMFRRDRKRR